MIAKYNDREWKTLCNAYKERLESVEYPIPFRVQIREVIGNDNAEEFSRKTGLSEYMFRRMKNQICKEDLPQRNTLISVCIGYGLTLEKAEELLNSLGLCFQPYHIRDYTYKFLFEHCRGKSIDECNEILKVLKVEKRYWLGKYARRQYQ